MNTHDGIVPEILSEVPTLTITITYPNGKEVQLGQELTPADVQDQPTVKWDANAEKYYTLVMIDPDAPCRRWPLAGQVNHWMVVNITGSDLSTGHVIAGYRGSGPPRGTGFHRYIFALFEHDGKVSFDTPKDSIKNRVRFSVKKFMEKYNFERVFAWNYFNAKWNPPVDSGEKRCSII